MINSATVGTKLFANYGAMSPVYELTVKGIDEAGNLVCENNIDDMETFVQPDSIKVERPATGSPIGIYFNEMDAF